MTIFDSIKYPINDNMLFSDIWRSLPLHFRNEWANIYKKYIKEFDLDSGDEERHSRNQDLYEKKIKQMQEYILKYEGPV